MVEEAVEEAMEAVEVAMAVDREDLEEGEVASEEEEEAGGGSSMTSDHRRQL